MRTRTLRVACVVAVVALLAAARPAWAGEHDQAIDQLARKAAESLSRRGLGEGVRTVGVVPAAMDDDHRYAASSLENKLTMQNIQVVVIDKEKFDKLLGVIGDEMNMEDMLKPDSIKKIGELLGTDALLFVDIREKNSSLWSMLSKVRADLKVAKVDSRLVLWGDTFQGEAWMGWDQAVTHFWRYPLMILAALIVLIVFWTLMRKAIKKASRPR